MRIVIYYRQFDGILDPLIWAFFRRGGGSLFGGGGGVYIFWPTYEIIFFAHIKFYLSTLVLQGFLLYICLFGGP